MPSIFARIDAVEFYPELKYDLYLTNVPEIPPLRVRDPQKATPLLRLSSPFHIACPSGIALLHYIDYAEETLRGAEIVTQPKLFLSFARQAREWLHQNYSSQRGRNTADRPAEYERILSILQRKQGVPSLDAQN